jgi:glycerate kinase
MALGRALASPASLKGVLTAREAASALVEGFALGGMAAEELAVADGGDDTAEVLHAALGGEWREAEVSDPLGRPVGASWLLLPDGTAVVESAAAIGLRLLAPEELDPLRATSRGLGELLVTVVATAGVRELLVCLGGSATVDGGEGMRDVLRSLSLPTTVLHDVRTTLPEAARLFGPQKGATPEMVGELERRLAGMRELRPYAEHPGSGAAGGLGAALAALGARLVDGAPYVLERIGFRPRARQAALVVTGEGRLDRSTWEGKAPAEVDRVCRGEGVRCALFGGRVADAPPGAETYELSGNPDRAPEDLVALGKRLAGDLRNREPR